ncbi:MAG: cytochrome b/b6 domain-containing protein [Deltaproteobacteria bacterium]|nr:cytochrome b/b6 domain-containing protein [Deltaproteobacteria bacterium]
MMGSLVYRHKRVTRITHWVNALALLILFMSGLQIFNAYPALHWGHKAEPDEAFFSIYASDETGVIKGYTQLFGWRVETTGFLGVQESDLGPFPRAFPSWLTIPGYFWLAGGRRWHFFFAWIFVLNGLLYFAYSLARGHLRQYFFTPRDTRRLLPMVLYYLRLRRESPQEGDYNPLQKLAYTGVFFFFTPLIILSGFAMSPQLNVAFNWLPAMFGGRQSARAFHFILTFLFFLFTFGHIIMVATTGIINNMRSMVTGWYAVKATSPEPEPAPPQPEAAPPEPAPEATETIPEAKIEAAPSSPQREEPSHEEK